MRTIDQATMWVLDTPVTFASIKGLVSDVQAGDEMPCLVMHPRTYAAVAAAVSPGMNASEKLVEYATRARIVTDLTYPDGVVGIR